MSTIAITNIESSKPTIDKLCEHHKSNNLETKMTLPDDVIIHTHFQPNLSELDPILYKRELYKDTYYEVICYGVMLMPNGYWLRSRYSDTHEEWSLKIVPKEYEGVLDEYVPYYELRDPSQISSTLAKFLNCEEEEDLEDYNLVPMMSIPFVRYLNEARTLYVDIALLKDTYYMVGTLLSSHIDPKPNIEMSEGVVASKALAFLALHCNKRYLTVTNNKYSHLWQPFMVEHASLGSYVTPLDEWLRIEDTKVTPIPPACPSLS